MDVDARWVVLGLLAALALGFGGRASLDRWRRVRVARRRARRARRGEEDAEALLTRAGFRVLARQPTLRWGVVVDGVPVPVDLRADLLVARHGRRYVAEVKTGERAPDLAHRPTRRQLLEYRVAFDADGVLLVEVERGLVRHVVFPLGRPGRVRAAAWLVAGLVVGAVATWVAVTLCAAPAPTPDPGRTSVEEGLDLPRRSR